MNLHDISYDCVTEMSIGEAIKLPLNSVSISRARRVEIPPQKRYWSASTSTPTPQHPHNNPMTSRLSRSSVQIFGLAVLGLTLALVSPARADAPSQVEDAHQELAKALNTGGPTSSDSDRIQALQHAKADLATLPPGHYHRTRGGAVASIKAALLELGNGDPNHQADKDLRDADGFVRDLEDSIP
jgi:hypothetical protein